MIFSPSISYIFSFCLTHTYIVCKPLQDLKNASLAAINVPMAPRCCGFALGITPCTSPANTHYTQQQQQQHVLLFLRFGILNFYYLQFALMLWKKACGCYGFGFSSCPSAFVSLFPLPFSWHIEWPFVSHTHTCEGKKRGTRTH